eukprot:scaffold6162_cov19-Tisochrysis_lutea.AAC.2
MCACVRACGCSLNEKNGSATATALMSLRGDIVAAGCAFKALFLIEAQMVRQGGAAKTATEMPHLI